MIKIKNVSKIFNGKKVLKNINLEIKSGEFVVLIGQSGSGKTTLLKLINKLIKPTSGEIFIGEEDISKRNSISLRREIGYVIQKEGLMPHMNIGENIELIPKLLKWNKNEMENRSKELLNLVGLDPIDYYDRYPSELSGGQRQRVGIARALANNPDMILMDEPFSALDPITRENLQQEILSLQKELNKTIVFVTHDMDEALKIADKIAILKDGEIIQYDTPENILKNPINEFVENFVGKNRLWKNPDILQAKDIMRKDFPKVTVNGRLITALEIMDKANMKYLIVVEKDRYKHKENAVGVIFKWDITLKAIDEGATIEKIMKKEFQSVFFDEKLTNIIKLIEDHTLKLVVVTDRNKKLLGVITANRLITMLARIIPQGEGLND
ncbi:osmoprotectant transport system ATP-binding protein [Cetobacterium ceti]|uniref:Osmoprotectant transport system ATP-binding protein n=1 Tax=Cetobacterium ceti TaxID=180163 RepID=A0A1T4LIP0_9FUSO|nr:betaine/proline/choline family ABC transporter ATP-binding protein [Cetobacterium ceti]SJZ54264.1 osmoprotectant transport system ATP-binding protein [Cetobacterium ceti]